MTNISVIEQALNDEQNKAITFGEGPLLIIAGAGTGKTTVITERIKHIIMSGRARPDEILALTFTEKASREMEERVDVAMPYGTTQLWISTFHAFCDRLLRSEAIHIGLNPAYSLMTDAETQLFFRKHLFSYGLSYFRPLGNPTKFISAILQHFSRLKDEDISPKQYSSWVQKIPKASEDFIKFNELANVYASYEESKVKEGVADYSDLISNTLKLFRSRKNILIRYQEQFKYLLIDEFQDTNYAQNELAVLLAGSRKNITVVGDDDQAIYRWRGAAVSNILQFRKRFPKTSVIVLTKNYRSTQEILDRSYELIQKNNPDRLEVIEKIDKKLESMRRINGVTLDVYYADRVENEAEFVAKKIKSMYEEALAKGKHVLRWNDFAVLVRANNHAEPFLRAFHRLGVPFQFLGPGQLFKQPEIKDLIAYLKILYNFEDNVAFYRMLSSEWIDISARDIAVVSNISKKFGYSFFETCERVSESTTEFDISKISETGRSRIHAFIKMVHRHFELIRNETAGQILYYFLQDTGILTKLATFKSPGEERIAENIAKFFNKLKTYEIEHEDASVYAIVDWIDLSMNLGESPLASDSDWIHTDAVNILTVHSSKGLEFPVVFIVNLVSQRFPSIERKEQIPIPDEIVKEILPIGDSHVEEERRIFYVAMTRAKDRLFLTAAKYYGEGKREKKISPFVLEATGRDSIESEVSDVGTQLTLLDWKKAVTSEPIAPTLRTVSYLSYSQISSFQICPLQYRYSYILKIPVPISAALTFGDSMHKTIHDFYMLVMQKQHPTKKKLLELFDTHWSHIGYGNKTYEEKMKKQGESLLKGYYDTTYDVTLIPLSLEEAFKVRITPSLVLGGKIDRVDLLSDGKIEIIDYKTGQAPKSRNPADDFQLTVYALAACDPGVLNKSPDDVKVSFYFFDGQEKISATRSREQLDEAKKTIEGVAQEISKSNFAPKPGKHCDFCAFRLICEAWQ